MDYLSTSLDVIHMLKTIVVSETHCRAYQEQCLYKSATAAALLIMSLGFHLQVVCL